MTKPPPFPESFAAYVAALRRYFRRRVGHVEADDLVQDVMVSVLAREASTPIENPQAYVFATARNALGRHLQRSALARVQAVSIDQSDPRDEAPSAERSLESRQALREALVAIEALPLRTRHIFILHRFGDMTYATIAKRFGISISAVEKHIMTALAALLACRTATQ